jgi:hypothetical protein
MPTKEFERILKWAEYAAVEELIEGELLQLLQLLLRAGERLVKTTRTEEAGLQVREV